MSKKWEERAEKHLTELKKLVIKIELKSSIGEAIKNEEASIVRLLELAKKDPNLIEVTKRCLNEFTGKIHTLAKEMGFMGKTFRPSKKNQFTKKDEKNESKTVVGFRGNEPVVIESSSKHVTPEFEKNFKLTENYYVKVKANTPKTTFHPEVTMSRLAYNKIMTWGKLLPTEIEALGVVDQDVNEFYIKDFFLFHQVVSGATCSEKDPASLCELMDRVEKLGHKPSDLRAWWHSHNSMGTSPSGQDVTTAKKFGGNSFLISLISNHDGDINCILNIYKPFEMIFEDLPVYIEDEGIKEEFVKERKAEIELYVKRLETSVSRTTFYGHEYTPQDSYWNRNHGVGFTPQLPISPTVIPEKKDEIVKQGDDEDYSDSQVKERYVEGKAPYGFSFLENGVSYIWSFADKKYKVFHVEDLKTELTKEEILALGVVDYNDLIDQIITDSGIIMS